MARMPDLEIFAEKHGLKIVSVADLVRYRVEKEMLVRRVVESDMPTSYGVFRTIIYENMMNGETHVALVMGDVLRQPSLYWCRRPNRERYVLNVRSTLGEASKAIQSSLQTISEAGKGVYPLPASAREQSRPCESTSYIRVDAGKGY
jgi:3,4-dihydroxy 2-butanone 4-phosphate synthase/GTP cyclohydrolase II